MRPRTRAPDPVVEWPEVLAAVEDAQATDRAVAGHASVPCGS